MVIESIGANDDVWLPQLTERGRLVLRSATTTAVIDTLGAAVLSLMDRATGVEFLMRTPWAEEDWTSDPPSPSTSQTWHRRYPGGWHTLIPHAGEGRETDDGMSHPFHGEAGWRRWRIESAREGACQLGVALRTVPLSVSRSFALGGGTLTVNQHVTNLSRRPVKLTWTEHPALGEALISPRTTVDLDGRRLDLSFPEPGEAVGGFRTEASSTGSAVVHNPDTRAFAQLDWDAETFPYAHVWQEHGTEGFPWWGAVSALAVEPACRGYWPDGPELGPLVVEPGASLTSRIVLTIGFSGA